MRVDLHNFYDLLKTIDIDFIQKNYFTSELFYFLTPRKKCNCNNAKLEVTKESIDKAYQIFESYKDLVDQSYRDDLKIKLSIGELEFIDLNNNSLFKI